MYYSIQIELKMGDHIPIEIFNSEIHNTKRQFRNHTHTVHHSNNSKKHEIHIRPKSLTRTKQMVFITQQNNVLSN